MSGEGRGEEPGAGDTSSLPIHEDAGQEPGANAALPEWVPEFEGQRPPFLPGNMPATATHGAYSPRRVDPLTSELVDQVLADPATGYLRAAHWRSALWAWGRAEAQVQLLSEWLAEEGERVGNGVGNLKDERVRAAYLLLHRAEARATTQRTRLGLDPLSAARLGRDKTAAALDAAQGMKLLADEERRRQQEGGDDG